MARANAFVGNADVPVRRGETVPAVLATMVGVVEGIPTCQPVTLAKQKQINMPLCTALCAVLFANRNPRQAIADLMLREQKSE